jgi:hypothetical protein
MSDWVEKIKGYGSQLKAYERHLSALAMLGGFGFDNLAYGRVDHSATQTLLLVYIAGAAITIALLHYLESRPEIDGKFVTRVKGLLPAATQFAFGSLWSAFLVFYARSGVVVSSWPFLLVLVVIFVGNEVLKSYHSRLIFTTVLLAFALLSYAIFMVPVFVHRIGQTVFICSGVASAAVYILYLRLLDAMGRERWRTVRWPSIGGATAVFAAVFGLYFIGVLPPLPLAMQKAGIYQSVKHIGPVFYVTAEDQSWQTWFGAPAVMHVADGDKLYMFSAVFAPIQLNTRVQHIWQRYDDGKGEWRTVQTRSFAIVGSHRNGGYRGYTIKTDPQPGLWRVDVESVDGRLIGRTRFEVVRGKPDKAMVTTAVK